MREMNKKQGERYRYNKAGRQERYKEGCMQMAKSLMFSLVEEDGIIFKEKDGKKEVLCDPTNPKKTWEETSWILQEMIFEWAKSKGRVSKRVL